MPEVSVDLQKYANSLESSNIKFEGKGGNELGDKDFERLLSYGVLIPEAYALSFNDMGILLVGDSEARVSIAKKLIEMNGDKARVLAGKNPTLYVPNGTAKPLVFLNDNRLWEQPWLEPFLEPEYSDKFESFTVRYLFQLMPNNGIDVHPSDLQKAIDTMVFEGQRWAKTEESNSRLLQMLAKVKCYTVLNNLAHYSSLPEQQRALPSIAAQANRNLERIVERIEVQIR